MNSAPGPVIIVIGYGNPLRADDGVGQRIAEAIAGWNMAGVATLSVHQLTPELAESLAAAHLAVFVDARIAHDGEATQVRPIEPVSPRVAIGHTSDPRFLLALARLAYGHCPRAWSITVPATDFSLSERLSPTAERGMEDALRHIHSLFRQGTGEVRCTRSA